MISSSPLPFKPVSIALQRIELARRSDDLKIKGIDLESGRSVTIKVRFDRAATPPPTLTDLLLTMTLQRRVD
ncbi:MAG: hypothetical protein K2X07_00220 [Caulobacteraceae bacterium]|nr:hypothetical protein [Caulobacteraceae bacterium]